MLRMMRAASTLHLERVMSAGGSSRSFTEYFRGFDKVKAVRKIFGDRTAEVLRNLKVEFTGVGGYMWVNSRNGHLVVSSRYLNEGDKIDVYLDVIHELVHIKQLMDGKELFDPRYDYIDRPTEIEAYQYAVEEARRIGLTDKEIVEYLRTEWLSEKDLDKLARATNVKHDSGQQDN